MALRGANHRLFAFHGLDNVTSSEKQSCCMYVSLARRMLYRTSPTLTPRGIGVVDRSVVKYWFPCRPSGGRGQRSLESRMAPPQELTDSSFPEDSSDEVIQTVQQ